MTNGEKIQQNFECEVYEPIPEYDVIHVIFLDKSDSSVVFDLSWWNAEYKEPTTNNDCAKRNGCTTCSLDDGDDCCKKLFEESMQEVIQEPITKNNLGVDAVSRAEVLKLMQDNWHTHNGDWAMQESMDDIRALPPATPQESRIGHWISRWHAGHDFHFHVCSECNEEFSCDMETGISIDNYRYCPNCGCRMIEPQESEVNND